MLIHNIIITAAWAAAMAYYLAFHDSQCYTHSLLFSKKAFTETSLGVYYHCQQQVDMIT